MLQFANRFDLKHYQGRRELPDGAGMFPAISPAMVFAIIRLYPPPRGRSDLLEVLRSVRDLTVVRPGCLGCWLAEEHSPQNCICYGEQWASDEELYAHIRSDLYRRILAAIELSRQSPQVTFYEVAKTQGMELIEAVRNQLDQVRH